MVLDVARIKGRWQDDHFLRTGHLATLKGDYMEIKNVQIPFNLFRQLVSYHLMEDQSCSDRMAKRQVYTQSKTASTEEEREKSRQEYLDRRGISDSFRW